MADGPDPHSVRPPQVTVVVPAHDREATIERAVRSALAQTLSPLEVIVVDDASSDATASIAEGVADPRVRVIRHAENRAASAARNTGVRAAKGAYVAFLDSDDEWLPHHLAHRIEALERGDADGVFGAFYVERGGRAILRPCRTRRPGEPLVEYILSGRGDVRSSSLVFRREAIARLGFDPDVRKHQDWDLAARADGELRIVGDPEPTAVLHEDASGRMTESVDHSATAEFLARHGGALQPRTLARFHTLHAIRTLRSEGRSQGFHRALEAAGARRAAAGPAIRLSLGCLSIPGAARLFVAFNDLRVRMKARTSTPARAPGPARTRKPGAPLPSTRRHP